jgi:phospholipid/cholesterol/gamma-HCH transport system substrate-binding protein
MVCALLLFIAVSYAGFTRSFSSYVPVTLTADRSGLVMEPNAKVKMRGIAVGHVVEVSDGQGLEGGTARMSLAIDSDQVANIPANVAVEIASTSVFGAKYVDLIPPDRPTAQRLTAGAVLTSKNVATEVNTVFENVVELIEQIDPAKLNAILSAIADGVEGRGEEIGRSITDTKEILEAVNPRTDTIRTNFQKVAEASDAYTAAADDILRTIGAASTTSATVTEKASQLDALLLGVSGLSRTGIEVLGPNKDMLVQAVNLLEPTTSLLAKYNPELTCLLVGADKTSQTMEQMQGGGNGKSLIMDATLMLGDDPYRYPGNLPTVAAAGGPGGKPGCGSLPDVAENWPVRYLVTDTGFGTGLDVRPNPGIGFPGYANYLPVTRAVPEPPSIRYEGGPAPGPIPYPGAPPYGAPMYGPGGVPLYPGVPPLPAPPPIATPDPPTTAP